VTGSVATVANVAGGILEAEGQSAATVATVAAGFSSSLASCASPYADWTDDARHDLYEERAAIMEFDGRLSRAEAEAAAWREVFGARQPWH
jgi:hypothetical protein